MTINEIIATQTLRAYNSGVEEGRKQMRKELEEELQKELVELSKYGRTGLYGIQKAIHLVKKVTK